MYDLEPAIDLDLTLDAYGAEAAMAVEDDVQTIQLYLGPHRLVLTLEQAAEVRVQLGKALEL